MQFSVSRYARQRTSEAIDEAIALQPDVILTNASMLVRDRWRRVQLL
jgi:hypothetical protein